VKRTHPTLTEEQQRIYDLIGLEPLHIDDIISRGNLSPTEAAHTLLLLQMENLIQEVEGKRYIRRP
jgi:predicted Rossmann fold nucleotide-binding protein DprA/Smf involved in DNA uptake